MDDNSFSQLMTIAYVLLHIVFALGVYKSAKTIRRAGLETWVVDPIGWAAATLLLGPYFAGVYWLVHHSSIGSANDRSLQEMNATIRTKSASVAPSNTTEANKNN